jgi:hypothetical protein
MSLNAATIAVLLAKGLSGEDILEVARASENKADATAAERQQRRRDKLKADNQTSRRDVTRDAEIAPPNEYISNPPGIPGETNVSPPPFAERFVSAWNAGPGSNGARKATKLDASRKALLNARVRDHGEDGVLTAVANLGRSRFHCGENDRSWRADAGWLLKAANCLKAIEMADPAPAGAAPPRQWTDAEKQEYAAKQAARAQGLAAVPDRPPKPITRGPTAIGSILPAFAHGHH